MNYVGIDPSLTSTAMVANDKVFVYTKESSVYRKKGMEKWFSICENYINIRTFYPEISKEFSKNEMLKIIRYDGATDLIVEDIKKILNNDEKTRIYIEGYSYNSKSGDIIDLVALSTLLRLKLTSITDDIKIIPPSTLKKESCILTYPGKDIGIKKPKIEYRNLEGVAGGNFKKHEMYKAIIENKTYMDSWSNHLREQKEEIFSMKSVPKPYDDINDAFLLRKLSEKNI